MRGNKGGRGEKNAQKAKMAVGSLELLMGLGGMGEPGNTGQGNDFMSMMLFQQLMNGGGDLNDNKRLQMFLFAPLGKKLLTRLAKRIQQKSLAEGIKMARSIAELHAADILRDLEEEQEGDLRQILRMARMSVRMSLLGSTGTELGNIASYDATEKKESSSLGVGGFVTGLLEEEKTPAEEIEEIVGEGETKVKAKTTVTAKTVKKKLWE